MTRAREDVVDQPNANPNPNPNEPGGKRDPLAELQARVEAALDEVRPKIKRALEELDQKVDAAVADLGGSIRPATLEDVFFKLTGRSLVE